MFDYTTVKETSNRWGISERRIQKLCEEKRIPGVVRLGHSWIIPRAAEKPKDLRFKKKPKGDESHVETD